MNNFKITILGIIVLFSFSSKAQNLVSLPKLKVFKFYPIDLANNTLSVGLENFNLTRKKSTVFTFGLIYRNAKAANYTSPQTPNLNNFDKRQGLKVGIERRIYVPNFREVVNTKNQNMHKYGFYLSPFLDADYQSVTFQNNYYSNYIFDPIKQTNIPTLVESAGKSKVFGIMPGFTLGVQTSLWGVLYLDMYAGGGLRIIDNNTINLNGPNQPYYYFNDDYVKEGIRPKIGFNVGIEF